MRGGKREIPPHAPTPQFENAPLGRYAPTPMFEGIDFYSDTLTRPSAGMRKAIAEAVVGDEQKGEDPTTNQLEERMAKLLGQESSMFFASATLANEVALRLLTKPGDEILAFDQCHLYFAETGGPAIHAGLMTRSIVTETGVFDGEAVRKAFRLAKGPHYPDSTLLSVENTTNMGGGVAWPLKSLDEVTEVARSLGMKTHLDGSRLWNAVAKEKYSLQQAGSLFDAVTVCFSKGMGCPTGAVLAFPARYRDQVRRLKQLFGGAMRQSGVLAAACLYALDHNQERIAEDHANAHRLAQVLSQFPELRVETTEPSTNMVFFRWIAKYGTADEFLAKCEKRGLRFSPVGGNRIRAVTHLDISAEAVEKTAQIVREVVGK